MPADHCLSGLSSSPLVAGKRRGGNVMHAIAAAVEPLERRLCLSAASLTPLGFLPGQTSNRATDVSGDGSVIVGYGYASGSGWEGFRWTQAGGMVGLGGLAGGTHSLAEGVSTDGSVAVGVSFGRAFRWTSGGGMVGLGYLPGRTDSWARGISGDGLVVVGSSSSGSGTEAFRWTSGGGMVGLGYPPGRVYSVATAASGDGSTVVGWSQGSDFRYEAFRWTSDGGMVGLGYLPGGGSFPRSLAFGVSGDGSVIVGESSSASGVVPFRWTSDGGMMALPGGVNTTAYGVSGDGSVIVGKSGFQAVRWTSDSGMQALWDVLLSHGVDPAADGWTRLDFAYGISHDGNTIVGSGTRNENIEAFVAVIPRAPEVVASAFQFNDLPHRIVTTFDQDVSASLGADDLLIENLTAQQTIPSSDFALAYDAATNTATFSYTGNASGITGVLPDGNYRATLLAAGITNGSGTPLPADHVFDFFFLNGDANRDGRVNLADFNRLAANFGQSDRDFTQGDFNYDTLVNLADFNILASRFGRVLSAGAFGSSPFGADDDLDHRRETLEELSCNRNLT